MATGDNSKPLTNIEIMKAFSGLLVLLLLLGAVGGCASGDYDPAHDEGTEEASDEMGDMDAADEGAMDDGDEMMEEADSTMEMDHDEMEMDHEEMEGEEMEGEGEAVEAEE